MRPALCSLFCLLISVLLVNPVFAHGAGGGGGGGGGSGNGGSGNGGNGGHGFGHGMGPGVSASAGHGSRGHTVSNLSRDSHRNRLHPGTHHVSRRLAHHSRSHRRTSSTERFAGNAALKGEKEGFVDGLPPGQESRVDRGKELSPGWAQKVGPVVTDSDTAADKALSPGQEIQADRGKVGPAETNP